MQADPQPGGPSDELVNSRPNLKRSDLSLQIPTKPPISFGSSRSGKNLLQSQDASSGSPSSRGFFRGLSFKKKVTITEAEKSSLLNPDLKTTPESPVLENSTFSWKKCASVPVTPASNLSPYASTPSSTRTYSERVKSHVSWSFVYTWFMNGATLFYALWVARGSIPMLMAGNSFTQLPIMGVATQT